jgi:hypothetical protein
MEQSPVELLTIHIDKQRNLSKSLLEVLESIQMPYKQLYKLAESMASVNMELSLCIMVRIILIDPPFFDEAVRDGIYLFVQSEGNRNTYNMLVDLLKLEWSEDVRSYIEDMVSSIRYKYAAIGIKLA